jgi:hypothetical protein
LTENVAFLTDFDPNLMVFNMDAWPYAVVDNSQKRGTGNREQGTGNLGTPVFASQGGTRGYKRPIRAVFVNQGGKRSYEGSG